MIEENKKLLTINSFGSVPKDKAPSLVEGPNGTEKWWLNGKLHKEDGPAIEYADGEKQWWENGERHRVDGPAVEYADGEKQWWLNGTPYSEENWKKQVSKLANKPVEEAKVMEENVLKLRDHEMPPPGFTGLVSRIDGTKSWWKNGECYRVDGPAREWADGQKEWWLNGKLHREDRPAVEFANGTKQWLVNDELHREDGPAIEWADGTKQWWLNGKRYSGSDWLTKTKNLPVNPVGEKVFPSGKDNVIYVRHYTQIPDKASCVVEWPDKTREWLKDGYLHREDGPAIERVDGSKEWWLNGFDYESEEAWKEAMSSKIIKTVKSDAKEVTKRIAVAKLTNLVTTMAVAGLRTPSKATSKRMAEFLSTDNGKALMGLLVGMSLPVIKEAVPSKYNTVLEDVATEFRIQSETLVLTKLVDNIIPSVTKLVQIGSGEVVDPEMFRVDTTACLSEGTPTNKNFEEETKEKVPHLRLVKG